MSFLPEIYLSIYLSICRVFSRTWSSLSPKRCRRSTRPKKEGRPRLEHDVPSVAGWGAAMLLGQVAAMDCLMPPSPETPLTPPHNLRNATYAVNSQEQSPASRILLRRLRGKKTEFAFRTPQQSGELQLCASNKKKAQCKKDRKKHNTRWADAVDPPPSPEPLPPPTPTYVLGEVGRPTQDAALAGPKKITRAASAAGWDAVTSCSFGRCPLTRTLTPHPNPDPGH